MNERPDDNSSISNEKLEIEVSFVQDRPFEKSEAEKKLVKKINRTFMPYACAILFIQFSDKTTLSVAAIIPQFYKDTGITHDQYSWLGSIFYFGFLCMQLPNNWMLQRFPVSKYVGTILVIWGFSLFTAAWAKNFSQLAALRFLLGFFEAVTYPSMFLLVATMYRRSEQVVWFGVMFMSNGASVILGSIISVGILQMPTVGVYSPWKWSMIIFGSLTVIMGFVYFIFLPDKPTSRWFRLTEEEKLIIEDRVRDNAVVPTLHVNYSQIWEALREPCFYCYCLISLLINLQNGALTTFSTIIVSDLGFSGLATVLLNIPSGIMTILLIAIFTYISKKKNEMLYTAMGSCTVSLIGLICLTAIPGGGVKLIGLYLSWGGTPTYLLQQASITSNVSGYTKKIFYTACNLIFYTLGNFIGPILLRERDAPRYLTGMGVYVAANVVVILLLGYIRFTYARENKKRHLDKRTNNIALPDGLQDITDAQNKNFVYHT